MSLIIKGMDMPKRGEYLHLEIYPNGLVWGDNGHEWVKHEAQAIEIPTPHGRLIDGDELRDIIKDIIPSWGIEPKIPTYKDTTVMKYINDAPTILEAED